MIVAGSFFVKKKIDAWFKARSIVCFWGEPNSENPEHRFLLYYNTYYGHCQ